MVGSSLRLCVVLLLVLFAWRHGVDSSAASFQHPPFHHRAGRSSSDRIIVSSGSYSQRRRHFALLSSSSLAAATSNDDGNNKVEAESSSSSSSTSSTTTTNNSNNNILECTVSDENQALKQELFKLAASYDRGFGASPIARRNVEDIVTQLEDRNRAEYVASTILGNNSTASSSTSPTLSGKWRMVWTSALDVLGLQASPILTTGAIYQTFDIENKIVTNIIDFLPRVQILLPPGLVPNSMIRAKVQTRAVQPAGTIVNEYPNRVGLWFESVALQPVQILGLDVNDKLPPFAFDLPKLPGTDNTQESPGYFDVTYLDKELLIIRQNQPGGLFALLRVESIDP